MAIIRATLIVAALAVASSCSPYDFSTPVGDLATKAKALDDSVTAGRQQMLNDEGARYRRARIASRSVVVVPASCQVQTKVELKIPPTDGNEDKTPAPDKDTKAPPAPPHQRCDVYLPRDMNNVLLDDRHPVPKELSDAMKQLTDYTSGLAAVTNAADRTAYNTAVSNLKDAVSKIPPYGTIAGAGINLLGWLVGTGLDIQRFQSLKEGVNAVGTPNVKVGGRPFDVVVLAIATEVNHYSQQRREILTDDLGDLAATLSPNISEELYRARLADIEAITVVLEALNQSNAISVANDLMAAHAKLVKAVNSAQPSVDELTAALSTLGSDVSALQSALASASTPPAAPKPVTPAKKGS